MARWRVHFLFEFLRYNKHIDPRQNDRHFADGILDGFSWMKSDVFWF